MISAQNSAIDAKVARLDLRINAAIVDRDKMEAQVRELLVKIENKNKYIRALGKLRSEAMTYDLFEDCA